MANFGDFGKAFSGVPFALEYGLYNEMRKGNGYVPPGASTRKPTQAGDVLALDRLKDPLGGINAKSQASLSDVLGRVNNQATTSAIASGRTPGSYQGQVIGQANTRASRGIEDALGGVLGGSSLQDMKNEQEYQDNVALAKEIGALNAPTMLQQILSLGNSGAEAGAQFKGLYDTIGKRNQDKTTSRSTSPALDLYSRGQRPGDYSFDSNKYQGYEPYDYKRYWS